MVKTTAIWYTDISRSGFLTDILGGFAVDINIFFPYPIYNVETYHGR